jgi:methyltransferase (TIGR00027 family)
MRDDAPSRTAQWVAAARGLGRLLPEAVRLADDPYGLAFSSARVAGLVNGHPGERAAAIARVPGLSTWIVLMQVRTRVIDDAVRAFVAGGGRQILVLGAGYDCRALRMPELADARVFEVDHPATQHHKLAVLERIGATTPARTLAWDFETHPMDDLADALAALGHDAGAATFAIWEGVTMYLTQGAIDATLQAIASWSAPGSTLAFDYLPTTVHTGGSLGMRIVQAMVHRLGEPFKFGWIPGELPGYLAARGFDLVRDVSIHDAARDHLPAQLAAQVARVESRIAIARSSAGVS